MMSHRDYDAGCVPPSMTFYITVVRLIDGYLGQVMFGDKIVKQTELFQDEKDNPGQTQAYKAAQEAITEAVGRLFS